MITANLFISNHSVLPHHCQISKGTNWSLSNPKPQEALTLARLHCQPAILFQSVYSKFKGQFWMKLGLAVKKLLLWGLCCWSLPELLEGGHQKWGCLMLQRWCAHCSSSITDCRKLLYSWSKKVRGRLHTGRKAAFPWTSMNNRLADTSFTIYKEYWSGMLHGTA